MRAVHQVVVEVQEDNFISMKTNVLSVLVLLFCWGLQSSFAQNIQDVIRYSMQQPGSTARSYGVGGAFGAMGADVSSAAINPAGMGRFRTNNFFISSSFYNNNTKASYIDNTISDTKFNFNVPNTGLVLIIPAEGFEQKKPEGFVNFVVGFNVNRLNNFHSKSFFSANNNTSISQSWAESASKDGLEPQFFSKASLYYLAYVTSMIDIDTNFYTPKYISAYGTSPIRVNQKGSVITRGAMNDYNASFAANYKHKLFFGISLGLQSIRHIENFSITETDLKTTSERDIKSVTLNNYIITTGVGFNSKFGVNYSVNEKVRLGYAYHSPTVLNLKDSFSYTMQTVFDPNAIDPFGEARRNARVSSEQFYYKYRITTPARHVYSLALVDKNIGFLSVDVESVNYTQGALQPRDPKEEPFLNENESVKTMLRSNAVNLRIGGEYIHEQYRFRFGYARYPSQFKNNAVPYVRDLANNIYSLGVGIKTAQYSIDFAYVNSQSASYRVPYTLENLNSNQVNQTITNNSRSNNIVISLGINIDQ